MQILQRIIQLVDSIPLGTRDDWDSYFLGQAFITSLRSTCGSRRVGAVIVSDNRIIASGYNGYPKGAKHCIDGGCPRFAARQEGSLDSGKYSDQYPCDAFHAEENAIYQLVQSGIQKTKGDNWTIYCTTAPCRACAKMINGAGITRVVYNVGYPDDYSIEYFKKYGIELTRILAE
ncbi:deoxycytidylate deaminase [Gottfriedia sp. NPDC057948]|uniref:deoxycytidylate deaminase n=1 Tax=Gottfriedia sp. NPDC057948 TaxID=3346287 RepID=UPI0036D88490